MTGPEHYREAERIAEILSSGKVNNRRLTADDIARYHAAGELHSRLALVAATADSGAGQMNGVAFEAWHKVSRVAR
jgi:hypothetical protein